MGDNMPEGGFGTTRTSFGPQPLGGRTSAPSYGFGAASRATSQKVFVSQEHTALATAGRFTLMDARTSASSAYAPKAWRTGRAGGESGADGAAAATGPHAHAEVFIVAQKQKGDAEVFIVAQKRKTARSTPAYVGDGGAEV